MPRILAYPMCYLDSSTHMRCNTLSATPGRRISTSTLIFYHALDNISKAVVSITCCGDLAEKQAASRSGSDARRLHMYASSCCSHRHAPEASSRGERLNIHFWSMRPRVLQRSAPRFCTLAWRVPARQGIARYLAVTFGRSL